MDEQETISRRDAILGMSVLGMLALGLVGTIVFRIAQASPRGGPRSAQTQRASRVPDDSAADHLAASGRDASQEAQHDISLPPATPIPVIAEGAAAALPASVSQASAAQGPDTSSVRPRPTFVAPSQSRSTSPP
jgi:hypothetical protein